MIIATDTTLYAAMNWKAELFDTWDMVRIFLAQS
jgi:hypothetical protein